MLPKNLGGYHPDPNIRSTYKIDWPCGSIFENEGIKLYELVRTHKPELIVEIGGHFGCSTSYLAYGVKDNKKGKVISIDINASSHKLLPKELSEYVEIIHKDATNFEPPKDIDMLFEDGAHTYGFTENILKRYKSKIVICHDYFHRGCKNTVKAEWDAVIGKPDETYFEAPSDCGLAIKYFPVIREKKKCKSC